MGKLYQWVDFAGNEQRYLRTVARYFHENGKWPTYKYLERELRKQDPTFDFDATARSLEAKLRGHPQSYSWNPTHEAVLNIPTLYVCPDMDEELHGFIKILRYCVDKYDNDTDDDANPIWVESTELFVALELPQKILCNAAVLFKNESMWTGFNGDPSGGNLLDWSFTIPEQIRSYRQVKTVEQYIDVHYGSDTSHSREVYAVLNPPPQMEQRSRTAIDHSTEVFVVHGHDEASREAVARYLEELGLHPIILHEQANRGLTIIEKFEKHSDVSFAVILLTPDDVGASKDDAKALKPRARQNVILEWGYFVGQLGRDKVCALKKRDVELPSDMQGLLWIEMDSAGAWKSHLVKELREAGILDT